MATRHNRRHGGGSGTDQDTAGESTGTEDTGTATEQETPQQETVANGPAVDTQTGEVHGEGYESTEEIQTDVVELPKKIVAKDIVGRVALKCTKKFVPELGEDQKPKYNADGSPAGQWEVTPPTPLYTVFGTANGTETGTTSYGDWTGFTGTFEAVRATDGKRFRSNRLILQEPAQTLLIHALTDVKKRDSSGSVNFAFNVGKRTSQRWVDTNEGNTYEYTIESIINVAKHDPLAHMRNSLLSVLPKAQPKQLGHDKPA